MAGDVESAIKVHLVYANLWSRFSALPETFDMLRRKAEASNYPLRPELIESTLYLYRATGDDYYLRFGERFLHDLINRTVVPCGLASIEDVTMGEHDDRMHSFVLSETLKYAYLLFDETNAANHDGSSAVFSTEGHILLPVPRPVVTTRGSSVAPSRTCPAYSPAENGMHWTPLLLGIEGRVDAEVARMMVGHEINEQDALLDGRWSIYGRCELPEGHVRVAVVYRSMEGRRLRILLCRTMRVLFPLMAC